MIGQEGGAVFLAALAVYMAFLYRSPHYCGNVWGLSLFTVRSIIQSLQDKDLSEREWWMVIGCKQYQNFLQAIEGVFGTQ